MTSPGCPPLHSGRRGLIHWTRSILKSHGLRTLDKLGQNFLIDPQGVSSFIGEARRIGLSPILEVGPGVCVLTYGLYTVSRRLAAVELDHGMAWACSSITRRCMPEALIARGDGVEAVASWRAPLVVSNTPYNITTQLIAAGARNNSVEAMILGMQLEVARRILAEPGSSEYGRITILARRYFKARLVKVLPRSSYYPEPRVSGAMVTLLRVRQWVRGDEVLEEVARCLFTGRRRLARKMAKVCGERLGISLCTQGLGDRRVYQLEPGDIEEMIKCGI